MTLATINDLNKLATDEKLIVLLEVEIPSTDTLYSIRSRSGSQKNKLI